MKEKYCGYFTWYSSEQLSNNDKMTNKIVVVKARIGSFKKMKVLELKLKDAKISHLKWIKFEFLFFFHFVYKCNE